MNTTDFGINKRNNGSDEADVLLNRFTAYLVTSVRRTKNHYLRKDANRAINELPLDESEDAAAPEVVPELLALDQVENLRLYRALKKIRQRDLEILLARAISEKTCAEIAEELGVNIKHISTICGRAINKIKKEMVNPDEIS